MLLGIISWAVVAVSGLEIDRKTGKSAYWEYRFAAPDNKSLVWVTVEGGELKEITILEKNRR